MRKFIFNLLVLFFGISFFYSCSESKYSGFDLSDNGIYHKFHFKSGDTTSVHLSDYVTVTMKYRLDDTVLFDSKSLDSELRFPLIQSSFEGDLFDALQLMSPGDSMSFVVVADSFYFNTIKLLSLPDFVTAGEPLYYDVKLIDVETNLQYKENRLAEQKIKQKEEISNLIEYIKNNNIEVAPLQNGLYFINEVRGKGALPDTGDMCKVKLTVSQLDGIVLFSNVTSDALNIEFGKQFDTKGFMLGLGMMRKGGKAKLIVPSQIGVGAFGNQGIDGFTTLLYEVELLDITSYAQIVKQQKAEEERSNRNRSKIGNTEKEELTNYLNRNRISQKPLSSGMYYLESKKGNGKLAKQGNIVSVHYKLFNLNGEILDSSLERGNPLQVEIGKGEVIEGWDIGLQQMNVGTKATFIIPSNLAYGSTGKGKIIKPNSTLVFDVVLVSIDY